MTNSETSSSQSNGKLTDEQADFICRKIAAFCHYRGIACMFLTEFPDTPLTGQQIFNKVRYMAAAAKNDKWRKKIEEYRTEIESEPLTRFAVGNRFERMKTYQRLLDDALEPRIRRILWYPAVREPSGITHYEKEEIIEPNYNAAYRALLLATREIEKSQNEENSRRVSGKNSAGKTPSPGPNTET